MSKSIDTTACRRQCSPCHGGSEQNDDKRKYSLLYMVKQLYQDVIVSFRENSLLKFIIA
jgi:hypothetical protein